MAENCWQTEMKVFLIAPFHMKARVCPIYAVRNSKNLYLGKSLQIEVGIS